MMDEKYVVFKRDDYERSEAQQTHLNFLQLDDAVVIRTKDPSAGPALHTYAAITGHSARLMWDIDPDVAGKLLVRADYFHQRAMEADATYAWMYADRGGR